MRRKHSLPSAYIYKYYVRIQKFQVDFTRVCLLKKQLFPVYIPWRCLVFFFFSRLVLNRFVLFCLFRWIGCESRSNIVALYTVPKTKTCSSKYWNWTVFPNYYSRNIYLIFHIILFIICQRKRNKSQYMQITLTVYYLWSANRLMSYMIQQ